MQNLLARKMEEVIARIDELTSSKGLRAAQRKALQECRRKFQQMLKKLEQAPREERYQLVDAVLAMMARTCELVNAYFCKKGEQ